LKLTKSELAVGDRIVITAGQFTDYSWLVVEAGLRLLRMMDDWFVSNRPDLQRSASAGGVPKWVAALENCAKADEPPAVTVSKLRSLLAPFLKSTEK